MGTSSYQLITVTYRGRQNDLQIWCRGEDHKKHCITVVGFAPYFYLDEDVFVPNNPSHVSTELGYTSIFGRRLKKIICTDPQSVGTWSKSFENSYESDIKYIRRFLIDSGIRNGFSAPEGLSTVYWKDLKPTNFIDTNLISITLDIEVETTGRFPDSHKATDMVSAVSFHDNMNNHHVTLVVDTERGGKTEEWSDEHTVIFCSTETELFEHTKSYLEWIGSDIIRNWNVFFDLDYLRARGKVIGVNIADSIDRYAHLDQLSGYRKIFRKSSNQLKDVVVEEGLANPEDIIVDGHKLYNTNRDLFIQYNMKDVKFCTEIDKKHRLTQYYWRFKIFCGLENFASTMFHSTKVDTLFLRYAYHVGHYVLPSKHYDENSEDEDEDDSYKGAVVLDPEVGIFEGIGVFDMSKFYPSIIMAYRLSPERSDGNGIFQAIITELMELREQYDAQLQQIKKTLGVHNSQYESIKDQRQVVKDLLNSVYGYAGEKISRLYNKEMAAKICEVARTIILYLKERVEKDLGYKVKYGDTDSLLIQIPFDKCQYVEDYANKILEEFCIKQGVQPILKIHFEKYYRNVMWVEAKGDPTRGAKKYYGANCIWNDGVDVDEIVVKGFDRGGGTSIVGRKILKQVLEMAIRGRKDDIPPLILETIKNIKSGKYTLNQIAINVGLSKDLDNYDPKHTPPYARGAIYANKFLDEHIVGGDKCKQIWVKRIPGKPPTNVISVLDETHVPEGTVIDYDEIIRSTIFLKIESIIKVVGISWAQCTGVRTLLSFYENEQKS